MPDPNYVPWNDRVVLCKDGVYRKNSEIMEYIIDNDPDMHDLT